MQQIQLTIDSLRDFCVKNFKAEYDERGLGRFESGEIPEPVSRFFAELRLRSFEIPGLTGDILIPSHFGLLDFQWGYAYKENQKDKLAAWPQSFFVVASQGPEPFVYDEQSQLVCRARPQQPGWEAEAVFVDMLQMMWVFSITGSLVRFNQAQEGKINEDLIGLAALNLSEIYPKNEVKKCLQSMAWL